MGVKGESGKPKAEGERKNALEGPVVGIIASTVFGACDLPSAFGFPLFCSAFPLSSRGVQW
jgi:hypothetical protein